MGVYFLQEYHPQANTFGAFPDIPAFGTGPAPALPLPQLVESVLQLPVTSPAPPPYPTAPGHQQWVVTVLH